MKVLHVIPSLGPLRGGPSFAVPAMARSLAHAGLEVHIAATDDNGPGHLNVPLEQPVTQDGVIHWYFRRQTRFYTFSWPLTRWLARHVTNFDLLHIHGLFSYATLPAASFATRHRVPYLVSPHGTLTRWGMQQRHPLLKKFSYRLIESHILTGAAVVHYTSEMERLEAAEIGVNAPPAVIPLGVDLAPFMHLPARGRLRAQFPQLTGRIVLLFLSRLDPKKGINLLLSAFAILRTQCSDAALVLAGDGEPTFVAGLRQQAAQLGIESDLIWTGFLGGEEKLAAFADADVFVLPSYSENFGVAVVEAMACSLPVVISDQIGIHRELDQAKAGLVVPCKVAPLVEVLARLVRDAELRQQLGKNGRHLTQERFSVEAVTTRLTRLYSSVTHASEAKRMGSHIS